ncbi:MAG: GNAT family N-acetyltransferase [Phenylobacterium sp.]
MGVEIRRAESTADFAAVAALFEAYAQSLEPVDLSYQDFATEVANLPGKYGPPKGELLIAVRPAGEVMGCVALRPQSDGDAEMKRLYVTPAGRGLGLGRALVEAIVSRARAIGYAGIKLDTLPTMTQALALYRQAGFVATPRYYDTPVEGTVFLRRALQGLP